MELSPENRCFIENYKSVLYHHIDSILKSRVIVNDDLQLIMTFWNPEVLTITPTPWNRCLVTSASCATMAALTSLKFGNVYPLTVSALSLLIPAVCKAKQIYTSRKYKSNFEQLLRNIDELYDVHRNVKNHFKQWEAHTCNIPVELRTLLMESREQLLRQSLFKLAELLDTLRIMMSNVYELIPVMETAYGYEWDSSVLKDKVLEFKELKMNYNRLFDFYVLFVSSFLSAVALSMCTQLWRNKACKFEDLFNKTIPSALKVVNESLYETKNLFNSIRFTLWNSSNEVVKRQNDVSGLCHVRKPLEDLLINMQVTFETARQIQILIEENSQLESCLKNVEELNKQFEVSNDLLNSFVKGFYLLTRPKFNRSEGLPQICVQNMHSNPHVRYDDIPEAIEDEEWNLSVHGSEPDEAISNLNEFADETSVENLELLLYELKRKLRVLKGSQANQLREPDVVIPPPPIPPPRPSLNRFTIPSELPSVDSSHRNFLDTVKAVAQNLNREEEFHFGFNMYPEMPRPFSATYSCFSVAMLPGNERVDVERGGKIIMPTSALEQLTRLNINYPMLFKITNKKTNRITHCGVLEFVADEGKAYLPLWMMHNLVLEEGHLIQVESVSIPVGSFAKFQPLSPEFLDITNPKAVLENCLRTFACLTTGDVIAVTYNQKVYELCVLETKPGDAISIIECDMNVDFAPPVGYKEHEPKKQQEEQMVVDPADLMPESAGFVAFRGSGNRLDGKPRKDSGTSELVSSRPVYVRGIPDYDYVIGTITFQRHAIKNSDDNKESNDSEFKAFSGEGFKLRYT